MFHLLKAQLHAAALDPNADPNNPVVAVTLDCANAFNSLTRTHLVDVLDQGCDHYVQLSQDAAHSKPVGWDIMYGHLRAHYGVSGILKYYSRGEVHTIQSESGVQQGDPLGSLLFALGIHPLLLAVGRLHPHIFISAYADNCILTGPLNLVQAAVEDFNINFLRAGLSLNPADSAVYSPSWLHLPTPALLDHHAVEQDPEGHLQVLMSHATAFPLKLDGIKVLGCPIGSEEFCDRLLQTVINKVDTDLAHLRQFAPIHQRLKLAIYCCNTRITYLLRAVTTAIAVPRMREYDNMFDNFMAHTLAFETAYTQAPHAQAYLSALCQCRLGIKQGGMGLTSAAMIAPAALHVALREFRTWYHDYVEKWTSEAVHNMAWLRPATAPLVDSAAYFPHFRTEFDSTVATLLQDWSIAASEDDEWPQHHITQQMKEKSRDTLLASLPASDAYRLAQVSQSSCPSRSISSDIRPAPSHDSDCLRQCPMGHFSLTCPFELSNAAIHTSTALLLGYPVPHARYLQTRRGNPPIDPWADMLLNDSYHAAATRHASHDAITNIIANLASSHGVSTTARLRLVPLATPDTMERGDLVAASCGILSASPSLPSSCPVPSKLILDFVLGHTYTSTHGIKTDTLATMEETKCRHYSQKYHEQGFAFAPLVANSFGQLGPEFLRFLWALADHAARNYIPVPLPVLPVLSEVGPPEDKDSPQVVRFKRLRGQIFVQARLQLLTAVYEAVTHRVFGRTFPLQADAQYWATLSQLSTVWSSNSVPLSQDSTMSSSASVPAHQAAPGRPFPSYAGVVAALPMPLSSVFAPPLLPSDFSSERAGHLLAVGALDPPSSSDRSRVDGVSASPPLSLVPLPLRASPPHSSPAFALSS
jgi:hypothetical protein